MAVSTEVDVRYQRFSGYVDKRYPEGMWYASTNLTGDGTGGNSSITLVFTPAAEAALNTRMYSIESLHAASNDNAGEVGRLSAQNLGGRNLDQALVHQTLINLDNDITGATLNPSDLVYWKGVFLGSQRAVSTLTGLTLIVANTNSRNHVLQAQGYWWGQRSVLADGGPQRPPTGLWRN